MPNPPRTALLRSGQNEKKRTGSELITIALGGRRAGLLLGALFILMKNLLTLAFLVAFLLTGAGAMEADTLDRAFELACLSMVFGIGAVITDRWTSTWSEFFKETFLSHDDEQ